MQETWLLSEFCDKGNLDRAVSGGRFHDKATGAPEMVREHCIFPSRVCYHTQRERRSSTSRICCM